MSQTLGNKLPPEVINLFNRELTTVVVSTIAPDGTPHALPIGLIKAVDAQTIRMGFMKGHLSVANIKQNPAAFITVMDDPDIAIGVRGKATVIREPMRANPAMCLIEFKVAEVKSDTTPTAAVYQGVRYRPRTDKGAAFLRDMFDELTT